MRIVEALRSFIRKEDPVVWKSLLIASALTLIFYVFVLVYTR